MAIRASPLMEIFRRVVSFQLPFSVFLESHQLLIFYEVLDDQKEVALAGLSEEDDTVTGQGGGCGCNSGLAGS